MTSAYPRASASSQQPRQHRATAPAPTVHLDRGYLAHGEVTTALTAMPDEALITLLTARPDLASPAPSSVAALSHRVTHRASVERALAGADAATLAIVEAIVALTHPEPASALPAEEPGAQRLAQATGLPLEVVSEVLRQLQHSALLIDQRPIATLAQSMGEHPAGLGPWYPQGRSRPSHQEMATLLAEAPPEARKTVEALMWGPPVGTMREELPPGAAWLVERGLLLRTGTNTVALPREVALVARAGRTRQAAPELPAPHPKKAISAIIAAESALQATQTVRLIEALLDVWEEHPAGALKNGGVGVREIRRTAQRLEVPDAHASLVAEVAAAAGLLWRSEDDPASWGPSDLAAPWREDDTAARWVSVLEPWLASQRAPWRIGMRTEAGALIAALSVPVDAPWAARLRRESAQVLAEHPGGAVSAEEVAAVLAFRHPRLPSRREDIAQVLEEFHLLGVTGAGALSEAAAPLVHGEGALAATQALERALPAQVDELIIQGDLSAIVPGPPTADLAELLELTTRTESRGSALTVRFTDASVRRALETGISAADLLGRLRSFSRSPLPQPLEYLVRDVERRHGQVRLGGAGTYLRAETSEPLLTLIGQPDLADLGLRLLAPTVAISAEDPQTVLRTLRRAGHSGVLEDASGAVVPLSAAAAGGAGVAVVRGGRRRGPARPPTAPGRLDGPAGSPGLAQRDDLAAVVARARAGDATAERTAQAARDSGSVPAPDPVLVVEVLRAAAGAGTEVDVVVVTGSGATQQRRLRPIALDAGRVRLRDVQRDVDLTVALSHIAAAIPVEEVEPLA